MTCRELLERRLGPITLMGRVVVPPTGTVAGVSRSCPGDGLLTASLAGLELPPPGAGFETVMEIVPAVARSAAESCRLSWEALSTVVGRAAPFTSAVLPATKFVPVMVRVAGVDPARRLPGASMAMVGSGSVTGRGSAGEAPPPGAGLRTSMESVPAMA